MAVEVCAEIALASPKSTTLIWPRSDDQHVLRLHVAVHQTRPRGRRPGRPSTGSMISRARSGGSGASWLRMSRRVRPSTYSITMYGRPSSVALVEHRHHVGVGELGRGPGLAVELAGELGVVAQPDVHHLDGNGPGQPGVDGDVDRGHPAAGEALGDLVATVEQLPHAGGRRHSSWSHLLQTRWGSRPCGRIGSIYGAAVPAEFRHAEDARAPGTAASVAGRVRSGLGGTRRRGQSMRPSSLSRMPRA